MQDTVRTITIGLVLLAGCIGGKVFAQSSTCLQDYLDLTNKGYASFRPGSRLFNERTSYGTYFDESSFQMYVAYRDQFQRCLQSERDLENQRRYKVVLAWANYHIAGLIVLKETDRDTPRQSTEAYFDDVKGPSGVGARDFYKEAFSYLMQVRGRYPAEFKDWTKRLWFDESVFESAYWFWHYPEGVDLIADEMARDYDAKDLENQFEQGFHLYWGASVRALGDTSRALKLYRKSAHHFWENPWESRLEANNGIPRGAEAHNRLLRETKSTPACRAVFVTEPDLHFHFSTHPGELTEDATLQDSCLASGTAPYLDRLELLESKIDRQLAAGDGLGALMTLNEYVSLPARPPFLIQDALTLKIWGWDPVSGFGDSYLEATVKSGKDIEAAIQYLTVEYNGAMRAVRESPGGMEKLELVEKQVSETALGTTESIYEERAYKLLARYDKTSELESFLRHRSNGDVNDSNVVWVHRAALMHIHLQQYASALDELHRAENHLVSNANLDSSLGREILMAQAEIFVQQQDWTSALDTLDRLEELAGIMENRVLNQASYSFLEKRIKIAFAAEDWERARRYRRELNKLFLHHGQPCNVCDQIDAALEQKGIQ